MEKRRRSFQATSQPECMEDLEGFSGESYSPTSGRKKEPSKSNFFRITAVIAFLVIVSIMFFSGNVTERLSSFGLTKEAATPKYEIDIDMNKPDLQSPALKARAADMIQNSKIEIIRALNKKCQVSDLHSRYYSTYLIIRYHSALQSTLSVHIAVPCLVSLPFSSKCTVVYSMWMFLFMMN